MNSFATPTDGLDADIQPEDDVDDDGVDDGMEAGDAEGESASVSDSVVDFAEKQPYNAAPTTMPPTARMVKIQDESNAPKRPSRGPSSGKSFFKEIEREIGFKKEE